MPYRNRTQLGSALVALAMGATVALPATARGNPLAERIEAYVAPFAERGDVSGTLLVARDDEILFEHAWGLANRELGVPNRLDTRFCIASVTKPMTMVLAIRMMETGKLDPAATLSTWFDDFPRGDEITVENLLRHRAGIAHRVTEPQEETVPRTAADMVEFAKRKDLLFDPGERSVYSSAGYSVLARVLELVGGASYQELLEEWVFAPAAMERSAHADARELLEGRASSYLPARDGFRNTALKDNSYLVGAGSVWSTARDLYRMERTLVGGGYGESARLSLVDDDGLDWNGMTNGFRAFVTYDARTKLTIVYTANVNTGAGNLLRDNIPRLVAGEDLLPAVPEYSAVTLSDAVLMRYEGLYELRPGSLLDVRAEDGALYANDWIMIPTSETTFFSPQDYAEVSLVLDGDGTPIRLDWGAGDSPHPCPRIGDRED